MLAGSCRLGQHQRAAAPEAQRPSWLLPAPSHQPSQLLSHCLRSGRHLQGGKAQCISACSTVRCGGDKPRCIVNQASLLPGLPRCLRLCMCMCGPHPTALSVSARMEQQQLTTTAAHCIADCCRLQSGKPTCVEAQPVNRCTLADCPEARPKCVLDKVSESPGFNQAVLRCAVLCMPALNIVVNAHIQA